MELNEYQKQAMTTCTPSSENFAYMLLNLQGEVGEVAGKVAKGIRKEQIVIKGNELVLTDGVASLEIIEDIKMELGDVLWQLSGLCGVLGFTLEEVASANLEKLASRKDRGVIVGDGDNR